MRRAAALGALLLGLAACQRSAPLAPAPRGEAGQLRKSDRALDVRRLRGLAARLVPERHGPLLNDEHVLLVRFALPEDELVRFEEAYATAGGELAQIAIGDRVERRMLLEEVGDAIGDSGSVHGARFERMKRA